MSPVSGYSESLLHPGSRAQRSDLDSDGVGAVPTSLFASRSSFVSLLFSSYLPLFLFHPCLCQHQVFYMFLFELPELIKAASVLSAVSLFIEIKSEFVSDIKPVKV